MIKTYHRYDDRDEHLSLQQSQSVDGEQRTGLGEQHKLRELPADDEHGRGGGDGQNVPPTRPGVPQRDAHRQDLGEADREGEALPQRRRPHDSRGLAVVVEEADDGEEAAGEAPGEEVPEEQEERGGGARTHPHLGGGRRSWRRRGGGEGEEEVEEAATMAM